MQSLHRAVFLGVPFENRITLGLLKAVHHPRHEWLQIIVAIGLRSKNDDSDIVTSEILLMLHILVCSNKHIEGLRANPKQLAICRPPQPCSGTVEAS